MRRSKRNRGGSRLAELLLTAALGIAFVACSRQGGAGTDGGAGGAGGTAGAGGLPPGCVDIQVDARFVPPELGDGWWGPYQMPWQPFWVDGEGVHVAWQPSGPEEQAPRLVVSSFDEQGTFLRAADYDVFPPGVTTLYSGPYSAAGGPDGAFAIGYGYRHGDPPEFPDEVLLGNVRDPSVRNIWRVPLGPGEGTELPYIAWDTEAFSVLYPLGYMHIARLLPDGTVFQGPTQVGTLTTLHEKEVAFTTDPATGRTYALSASWDGPWLMGHERDGTLLPGTEGRGGVLIDALGMQDGTSVYDDVAIAPGPAGPLLAWSGLSSAGTRLLELDAALQPASEPLIVPVDLLEDGRPNSPRGDALVRAGERWLLFLVVGDDSVDVLETDGRSLLSRRTVLTYGTAPACAPDVWRQPLDLRALQAIEHRGEVWFGFWDFTDGYYAPTHEGQQPYRVVRVAEGCTYRSMCDIHHQP